MSFLLEFASYAMIAVFLENILLSRALGTVQLLHALRHGRDLLPFGLVLTVMSTLASALTYPVNSLLKDWGLPNVWKPLVFLVVIGVLYAGVWIGLNKGLPKLFASIGPLLSAATLNGAVLGAIFLSVDQNFNFARTLGFGLGTGLGFLAATLLVREGRRRLLLSNTPHSFRGYPVMLLYLGVLALALYGLVGHQLPF